MVAAHPISLLTPCEGLVIIGRIISMRGRVELLSCTLTVLSLTVATAAQQDPARARDDRAEQIHRIEGQAVVALADAAVAGKPVPADLSIRWRHHFLKAQQGTFVAFIVTVDPAAVGTPTALLYVRLSARRSTSTEAVSSRQSTPPVGPSRATQSAGLAFAVEEVYPIDLRSAAAGEPVRLARAFSTLPGEYELVVVVRERANVDEPGLPRRAGVLTQRLDVPDFQSGEFTTSSVILADRLTSLERPPPDDQLVERPYLIGLSDIQPATDNVLRRTEELIVVLLVYNPFVTPEKKFDIEVEYHFFTRSGGAPERDGVPAGGGVRPPVRDGERYFNHTKPQRFTPAIMGPQFDPAAGDPLMAGQGVPLSAFPDGEYRLAIKVTDIVSGKSILTDVAFIVVS
jgi:hypothetical protein